MLFFVMWFFHFSTFLRLWNFQCYELCNIGINVDKSLLLLLVGWLNVFRSNGRFTFRLLSAFKATANWIYVKRDIRDKESLRIWHANPLIAMTMSLHYSVYLPKKQQQQHAIWLMFPPINLYYAKGAFSRKLSRDDSRFSCDFIHSPCYYGTIWYLYSIWLSTGLVTAFYSALGKWARHRGSSRIE